MRGRVLADKRPIILLHMEYSHVVAQHEWSGAGRAAQASPQLRDQLGNCSNLAGHLSESIGSGFMSCYHSAFTLTIFTICPSRSMAQVTRTRALLLAINRRLYKALSRSNPCRRRAPRVLHFAIVLFRLRCHFAWAA